MSQIKTHKFHLVDGPASAELRQGVESSDFPLPPHSQRVVPFVTSNSAGQNDVGQNNEELRKSSLPSFCPLIVLPTFGLTLKMKKRSARAFIAADLREIVAGPKDLVCADLQGQMLT